MNTPAELEAEARDLAARLDAERFEGLSGRVLDLDDPEIVWLPVCGRVDVQAVPLRADGSVAGAGRHLFEAFPGHMLAGTTPQGTQSGQAVLALRGRCAAGTVLYRTTAAKLRALRLDLSALVLIERWTESLAAAAAPEPRALSTDLLEADPAQGFKPGRVLCAPHGAIVWAEVVEGTALAFGEPSLELAPGMAAWPLTEGTWITLPAGAVLDGHLTPFRMASGRIWDDLDAFARLALRRLLAEREANEARVLDQQRRRAAWTGTRFAEGLLRLGRAVDPGLAVDAGDGVAAEDAWAEAFRRVAEASGIELPDTASGTRDLEEQALAAGVAFRSVRLEGDWWRADAGPLLGFRAGATEEAVALLPLGPGRYEAVDAAGAHVPVTAAFAAGIGPTAVMLYRPLPDRTLSFLDVMRFGQRGAGGDLRAVVLMGLLVGLVGLLTPIATGALVGEVLPRGDTAIFAAIILGLAGAALGNAAFAIVQAIAVSRVQARVDLSAQSAVIGRLLRLPMAFFRRQAMGDLADRAMGISHIRQMVTGAATGSLLGGLFAIMSGLLLIYYSPILALFALSFTLVIVLVEVVLFTLELRRQRQVAEAHGAVEACAFELLSAISKLRAAAAEPRAFARWSNLFAVHAQARRSTASIETTRAVIASVVPLCATALAWAGGIGAIGSGEGRLGFMEVGAFVAFQAAFSQFIAGALSVSQGVQMAMGAVPVWERLRPILDAPQETGSGRMAVGVLRGEIVASNLTFGYDPELPPALDGLNLRIASGEYVALVGPSGSGKSTLIRMLLGLEQPGSGAIYMDGMDLATLDLGAMRRQIGVVMQSGQLPSGSILEAILGAAPLPEEAAWEAARQAGMAEDIRAMPMGMQTVITEGGGGLSGGQRQRVMIARALVRRPRILLLDEATSALDNATQAEVTASLDRLNVTRIVVAHRLSTIRDVHRILVLDGGRIVEEGSYDELLARGGLFARLAARQIA